MKRQLLLSLTLAVLTANAYALPAHEQAAPQVQASHSSVSQVLNTLAENGSDRTPQAQHERENGLAENGSSKTAIGENDTFAENGSDRTPQAQHERENGLAENGSSKTAIGENDKFAADGGDRVIERNSSVS